MTPPDCRDELVAGDFAVFPSPLLESSFNPQVILAMISKTL